jgi:hypothetical protein
MKELKNLSTFLQSSNIEPTGLSWLLGAAVTTAILWQLPMGDYILYPFTILATWFHEISHGLMSIILGGNFRELQIFSNGSGVAIYTIPSSFIPLVLALIAAAGPMGPPIAGAGLIMSSRSFNSASFSLKILGVALLFSSLVWVRSWFGLIAVPLLGLGVLWISLITSKWVQIFTVKFLGMQACISTYHQLDYLFSYNAGSLGISDTGQMQKYLLLPYWFWGGLIAVASFAIMAQSLIITYRKKNH